MNMRFSIVLIGASMALGGCAKSLNTSAMVIDDDHDPSLIVGSSPQPSLTAGHERAHWERVTLSQPHKSVEVEPDYIAEFTLAGATARQRGLYPTVDSVLKEDRDHGAHFVEGIVSPVHAIGGVLLVPFRMVICQRWPGEVEMAPSTAYHRITPPPQTAEARIMESGGE